MRIFLITFILLLCAGVSFAQRGDVPVPVIHQRITDETNTLTSDEMKTLEQELASFEQETSNQIVVLMVSSLQGESLEDYTMQIAEKNKVGKKGRDNGILLFIAKEDHRIRIDVGYGLEGALPDAIADQIIRYVITPHFRSGDFFGGINKGLDAIIQATKGEFKGEPEKNGVKRYSSIAIILLILFFGIFPAIFGGGRRRYVGSNGYSSRFPWWWGGFGGGGFSSGSFGGGGGFGGFSGGGGSFGGGGASGSW